MTIKPTRTLERDRLTERVLNLFASLNMCVLATSDPDGAPHATPVRYFSREFTLIFTSLGSSPKIRNLRADPRVSAGVFAPLAGPESSRGAQLFGTARVLAPGDAAFDEHWAIVSPRIDEAERAGFLADPSRCVLGVISPARIVYTDHWLKRDGYAPRQTLTLP
ncbi:pyridoxamine 5'-phosphate oxidase family protein [Actinoplanes hulinensis]|uniref:Pyridoxamine 5'-phosphate oxidase family protein n=1 Tax=Actinoplanes hulinensis TaxID=1144547 RepID=A0ABS7B5I8_9ACTN|nr:pyridoxamine 5'-phosphate oxidase family protein [Actinoplanes hulinensis]MBW6436307.1 pyridoxamine 5'-phosphate oxidase family protein [Actinoplanes hulinensis]